MLPKTSTNTIQRVGHVFLWKEVVWCWIWQFIQWLDSARTQHLRKLTLIRSTTSRASLSLTSSRRSSFALACSALVIKNNAWLPMDVSIDQFRPCNTTPSNQIATRNFSARPHWNQRQTFKNEEESVRVFKLLICMQISNAIQTPSERPNQLT